MDINQLIELQKHNEEYYDIIDPLTVIDVPSTMFLIVLQDKINKIKIAELTTTRVSRKAEGLAIISWRYDVVIVKKLYDNRRTKFRRLLLLSRVISTSAKLLYDRRAVFRAHS